MKQAIAVIVVLLVFVSVFWLIWGGRGNSLGSYQLPEVYQIDNSSPTGSVIGLMDCLQNVDLSLTAQFISELPESFATNTYRDVLVPVLEQMEYQIGNEAISGNQAVVDISVTAVDVGSALRDVTGAATSYLVGCMLQREEADLPAFLRDYMEGVEIDGLMRVNRNATVYLKLDDAGRWRIDGKSEENIVFYNAVTGGLFDVLEALTRLAQSYSWNE